MKYKKLNVGSGRHYAKGYLNIDIDPNTKHDMICDITKTSFKDNTFDEVRCINVFEHLYNYMDALKEIWRILVMGGVLKFRVPMAMTVSQYAVIDHVSEFVPQAFIKQHKRYGYAFKPKVWTTPALIYKNKFMKFHFRWMYFNIIFPIFTGIEGELTKVPMASIPD
ncbi:MAG: methyltransferase domain-containing protein [Nanoarchaeota archaeon]